MSYPPKWPKSKLFFTVLLKCVWVRNGFDQKSLGCSVVKSLHEHFYEYFYRGERVVSEEKLEKDEYDDDKKIVILQRIDIRQKCSKSLDK